MIPVQPSFLAQPFAQSGDKNTIPNTGGDLLGNASLALGFPQVTEVPIELGGVPPQRKDFNGILYLLSAFAFYAQGGGVFTYSATANYAKPAVVIYNNIFYFCIKENGVDSVNGVNDPTDTEYWIPLIDYLLEGLAVGTPIGTIIMWASATNPNDGGVWLDCNGQDCTAYPKLVAVVGNNVPDLQGLFPRCVGSQDLSVTVGETTTTQTFNGGTVGDKTSDTLRDITGTFPLPKESINGGSDAYYTGAFSAGDTGNGSWSSDANKMESRIINFGVSNVVPVSSENKPASVALRFLIKAE